jgi:hypothetical protein
MKVTGGCHCGKIAYEAEVDPGAAQICHCIDCQILTGSAFRVTLPASPDKFRLLKGEPRLYIKVADSGSRRSHAFCGDCGAPVFRLPADNTPHYSLRIGGLDQRAEIETPKRQIWTKRRLPWVTKIGAIAEVLAQT